MRPLIGITPGVHQELPARDWLYNTSDYFRAVQQAGGLPVLLPLCDNAQEAAALLERIDGLLLSGGEDVDPVHFGEQPHPMIGEIIPERDGTELLLTRQALAMRMPILGICRGQQLLAVAAGGRLIQDIPAQVPGALKHTLTAAKYHPTHLVTLEAGTRLASLLGAECRVNSRHHQSVRTVPAPWVISAIAPDGVIEAMELPGDPFVVGVQWHPENFTGREWSHDALFAAFVDACRK